MTHPTAAMLLALVSLPAVLTAQTAPAATLDIDTLALRGHTRFLADDLLEGRGAGTRGERVAALYIVSQLQRLGVGGGMPDGEYLQPLPLVQAALQPAGTRLRLVRGGDTLRYEVGDDFILEHAGAGMLDRLRGDPLLAGTGKTAAAALAEAGELDGRIVVVLGGLGGAAGSVDDWAARGAEGVLLLLTDPRGYSLYANSRGLSQFSLEDPSTSEEPGAAIPLLIGGPDLAQELLRGAETALDALRESRPFTAAPLDGRIDVSFERALVRPASANVVGLVPGTDPARDDQVLVYTAHYDHVGVARPDVAGDSIYNGFSDNAAGVAMLLAIAAEMVERPPEAPVLFLFVAAEERGLLGSKWAARHPPIPLERMAALINLDAGAPAGPPLEWYVSGGAGTELGRRAVEVAESRGWRAELGPAHPNSDHWPFYERGVAAVFLMPGRDWEGLSPEQEQQLRERWDRYHQAGDEWSADFPFAGLARYAEFALAVGRSVLERPL